MLLEKGFSVTVNYRQDEEAVACLKADYPGCHDRLQFVKGDVTRKEDLKRIADATLQRFGRIDILINNAGPYIFERKKLADYSDDEWYDMLEGNLSAVFHLFKAVIPVMRQRLVRPDYYIRFSRSGPCPGWLHRSAFGAAKVGLASLTKTIAIEEAESGITANMVCPGDIVGDMKEASIEEARRKIGKEKTPIGRSGTGEDIARIIAFYVKMIPIL